MIEPELYSRLKDVASKETVVEYGEIAPLVGLDMNCPEDRIRIAEMLDEISTVEHHQGHPLLSVVVVQSQTGRPGKGFYKLARRLGLFSGRTDIHEMEFFVSTVKDAHRYWKRQIE